MKIFFLLLIVTQFVFDIEAKQALSKERVDVFYTFGSNNNEFEPRDHSISADITGHTLTIEGLRTTDNGLLTKTETKTKTKTKAKVFSNSFGLSQQLSSSPTAFVFVNSHGQQSTDYKLYTINSKQNGVCDTPLLSTLNYKL